MTEIRLDNHSAAKPIAAAVSAMVPYLGDKWGAFSSPYARELQQDMGQFLARICSLMGASPSHRFIPASSPSEAALQIFLSHFLDHVSETGRNHFLTTALEDASIQLSLNRLEKAGCAVKTAAIDSFGRIDVARLQEEIRPRTSLLSFAWANALTGVIQPLAEISAICRDKEVALHVDVSHTIGKLYFHLEDLYCDYVSLDGAKFHAPLSCSGYFTKKKGALQDINVAFLAALIVALEHADEHFDRMATEVSRLKTKLETGLTDAVVLFQEADRLPNVTTIAFPGAHSEALAFLLAKKGVYASFGGGQHQRLSHMLSACNVPEEFAESALSFALTCQTTEQEIDFTLEALASSIKQLRRIGAHI